MKAIISVNEAGRGTLSLPQLEESYRVGSLAQAVKLGVKCVRTGSGLVGGELVDTDPSLGVAVDGLVELKLKELISALFKAVEAEAAEVDLKIIRPRFEFSLESANGDGGK